MSYSFKRLLFVLIAIFVVLLVVINLWRFSGDDVDTQIIKNELGLTETTTISEAGSAQHISFPSDQGEVEARNFLLDPDVVDWDGEGTYMLGAGIIDQDKAYQIFYYEPDNSVSIVLLQEPFGKIRLVAEQQLLARLGVSEKEACKMHTRVNIPAFASESLSGKNLGLSFCPGSVEL